MTWFYLIYLEYVVSRQFQNFLSYVMAFDNNNTIDIPNTIDTMSIHKEDDSPQQQINEQSIAAQELEKNRECTFQKKNVCYSRKYSNFLNSSETEITNTAIAETTCRCGDHAATKSTIALFRTT